MPAALRTRTARFEAPGVRLWVEEQDVDMLERQADAHAAGLATRVDEDPAGGADAAEADGVRDRHLQLRDRVVRPVQEYHGGAGVRLEQAGLDELVTEGHGAGRAGENGRRDRQATLLLPQPRGRRR